MKLVDAPTRQGVFRGLQSAGVCGFKGIPYAANPVGPQRFAAPRPPTAHSGIADATAYGATVSSPPQRSPTIRRLLPEPIRRGDNPLNLNVWTLDLAGRLPVLVWFHGGGFVTGTGSNTVFDGSAFAREGVVVVTLNYRLGVEGFLWLPDAPSNRGLLDQIEALRWVRDNIAAFGGDPDRVTIAGESAGAMSVCTLLATPVANGLFHQAISQSGGGHHVHRAAVAEEMTAELCRRLNVPPSADGINSVETDQLHRVTNEVIDVVSSGADQRFREFRRLAFQPIVDGDVLPQHPVRAIRSGASKNVTILIGTNGDEYGLFTAPMGLDTALTTDLLRASVARLVDDVDSVDGVMDAYYAAMPAAGPAELFVAIRSDWFCREPTAALIDARQQAGGDCYVYEFLWRPTTFNGNVGACHTLEVPFVFDTLDDPWGIQLRGCDAPRSLAAEMHHAWAVFITTGHPGWAPHGPQGLVRQFDVPGGVVCAPRPPHTAVWQRYLSQAEDDASQVEHQTRTARP